MPPAAHATAPSLPNEILLHLATVISNCDTLTSLVLVSRLFNEIFTPALYRCVKFVDRDYVYFEKFADLKNLGFVRSFCAGRNTWCTEGKRKKEGKTDEVEVLVRCLEGMVVLEELTISLFTRSTSPIKDVKVSYALCALARRGTLRSFEVHFEPLWSTPFSYPYSMLSFEEFRGLNKIVLHGLKGFENRSSQKRIRALVGMLLRSPRLQTFGLSLCLQYSVPSPYNPGTIGYLEGLCIEFEKQRAKTSAPVLKLVNLELGFGFLPHAPQIKPINSNHLSLLTDLASLRSLKLLNAVRLGPMSSTITSWATGKGSGKGSKQQILISTSFLSAINLERISFTYHHHSLIEFIQQFHAENPSSKLESLKIGNYRGVQIPAFNWPEMHPNYKEKGSRPIVEALDLLGNHWKSLDFSDITLMSAFSFSFIKGCNMLEELTCGFTESALEIFKQTVLPEMKHLHTLMITPYHTRVEGIPVTRIPINLGIGRLRGVPGSSIGQLTPMTMVDSQKLEVDEEEESQLTIASSIFDSSWKAWNSRDIGDQGVKLRYVGLGYRVYTRMWNMTSLRTIRLPRDEEMQFESCYFNRDSAAAFLLKNEIHDVV
ncbi:hypothetical protein G7Y89_g13294 [Cudoniella acicularis]|uniref:F-box domain-containing protein n=1 Tax=Cudoniella acicularis TaxID=354080 RepID=A0A8H4R766_9HELO|nr:hypothetical protein G7Y89_g13294 [Cudoniella acicularis]